MNKTVKFLDPNQPLLVIIGPSGAGKSTAVKKLVKDNLLKVTPSWTTRPRRADETVNNDVEHVFINDTMFTDLSSKGFFIDTAQLFGLPYSYGLPKVETNDNTVPAIMLRAPLIPLLKKHYLRPVIYHIEAPIKQVQQELNRRDPSTLGDRLEQYKSECSAGRKIAKRVFVNDSDIETLVDKLKRAITEDFPLKPKK